MYADDVGKFVSHEISAIKKSELVMIRLFFIENWKNLQ